MSHSNDISKMMHEGKEYLREEGSKALEEGKKQIEEGGKDWFAHVEAISSNTCIWSVLLL